MRRRSSSGAQYECLSRMLLLLLLSADTQEEVCRPPSNSVRFVYGDVSSAEYRGIFNIGIPCISIAYDDDCRDYWSFCLCCLITSAEEGGYVFGSVYLSVCLSVRRITRKLVNGF